MSECYIDREKAIEAVEREFGGETSPECITAKEAVYSVELADVVPVVRCIECLHFYPFFYPPYGKCSRRHHDDEVVKTTDFCSYAKKKIESEVT